MPRKCETCADASIRKIVDDGLVSGLSLRDIGQQVGISASGIWRHAAHALPPMMAKMQQRSERSGVKAVDRIEKLIGRLEGLSDDIHQHGAGKDQLLVARELRPSIELLGKLTGEISSTQNALFVNLGVRDESEIRRALEVVREGREAPLEEVLEDALAAIKLVLTQKPELRQHAMDAVGRFSYAEETNGKAGKAYAEGNHEAHA